MRPPAHPHVDSRLAVSVIGLFCCILATLLSGCISQDLYRPLHVQAVPLNPAQVAPRFNKAENQEQQAEQQAAIASLKRVRARNNTLSIMSGKGSFSGLHFSQAFEALEEFPDNPFAWAHLGALCAFNRKIDSAIGATEKALEIVSASTKDAAFSSVELRDLQTVCRLNLANYHFLRGENTKCLEYLQQLPIVDLIAHHDLYRRWLLVQALVAIGALDEAQAQFTEAQNLPWDERLAEVVRGDNVGFKFEYDLIFEKDRRKGVFMYLAGLIKLEQGQLPTAEMLIKDAIAALGGNTDMGAFHAVFTLALLNEKMSKPKEAMKLYDVLVRDGRVDESNQVRPDILYYNRGNLFVRTSEPDKAIDEYKKAIKWVADRHSEANRAVKKYESLYDLPSDILAFKKKILAERPAVSFDVYNNKGLAHLKLARQLPDYSRGEQLKLAAEAFAQAKNTLDGANSFVLSTNLAELFLRQNQRERFLGEIQQVLLRNRNYPVAHLLLLEAAQNESTQDIPFSAAAYAIAVRYIPKEILATYPEVAKIERFVAPHPQLEEVAFAQVTARQTRGERIAVDEFRTLNTRFADAAWTLAGWAATLRTERPQETLEADRLAARAIEKIESAGLLTAKPWLLPSYLEALTLRAEFAQTNGRNSEAIELYRKILTHDSGSKPAIVALSKLPKG